MMFDIPTLALACIALLAVSYAVLGLLAFVPQTAAPAREALPILMTETVIAGFVVAAFLAGGWILTAALVLHAARIGYEAIKVAGSGAHFPAPAGAGVAIGAAYGCAALIPIAVLAAAVVAAIFIAILFRLRMRGSASRASALLDVLIFPLLPLALFTAAGIEGGFGAWLLAAFVFVETFDSCALLGGRLFGRRKAFPALSPNKTVEGLLIGAAMLALVAAVATLCLQGIPVAAVAGAAVVSGLLAVAGDLAASRLKRLGGVKDFPRVLRHQGGLLDITDAWIAAGAGIVLLSLAMPGI